MYGGAAEWALMECDKFVDGKTWSCDWMARKLGRNEVCHFFLWGGVLWGVFVGEQTSGTEMEAVAVEQYGIRAVGGDERESVASVPGAGESGARVRVCEAMMRRSNEECVYTLLRFVTVVVR